MVCRFLFWASTATLAYTFVGYQALVTSLARASSSARSSRRPQSESDSAEPEEATVLIVACDEAARIRSRIENLRESRVAVRIAVCSDGSSDGTAAEARGAGA